MRLPPGLLLAAFLLAFGWPLRGQAQPLPFAPERVLAAPTAAIALASIPMQYRSGGHVLGFIPEGYLVAGRDHLLKVSFVGAAPVTPEAPPEAAKEDASPAAPLTEVRYRDLWNGVDLTYDAGEGIVRSTYTLAPGAQVENIRLRYNVATELTDEGALKLGFASGQMHETAPIAWQEIAGERKLVAVAFHKHDNGEIGFTAGDYDPAHPLVIDPTLNWHTFLGGAGTDVGYGIATDTSGNIYVSGSSEATWGTPVRAYSAGRDTFVARLSAATGALIWNTFLGGAGTDNGFKIATDGSGNIYVPGDSNAAWGAPVRAYTGGRDAFFARLSAATGALTWHTFLGGAGSDIGSNIATDTAGDVYAIGYSDATWGAPVRAHTALFDAFVARLNAATGTLTWHTFLGGNLDDQGTGIVTDTSGNVYVTGYSDATWGAPLRAYGGGVGDAFVARLSTATGALTWHTFLGGAGTDYGLSITIDGASNVYVSGFSDATWGVPVRAYTAREGRLRRAAECGRRPHLAHLPRGRGHR